MRYLNTVLARQIFFLPNDFQTCLTPCPASKFSPCSMLCIMLLVCMLRSVFVYMTCVDLYGILCVHMNITYILICVFIGIHI